MHFERRNYNVKKFQTLSDFNGNLKKFILRSNIEAPLCIIPIRNLAQMSIMLSGAMNSL